MKPTRTKIIFIVPALIALIAIIVLIVQAALPEKQIVTGMVETTEIDVASKVPGRLDSLFVVEGESVHSGEVLAVIGSKEIDAKVEQARGACDAARSRLEMARNGARPEEREGAAKLLAQAEHQFALASKTWKRIQDVFRDSVISTQEYDQSEFQYKAAREQRDAAQARYHMVELGTRNEELRGAEALVYQAENAYNEALAYQRETHIVSPIDGEICKKIVDAGEIVASGYPVLTVLNPNDTWVVLQLREDQMATIRKDMTLHAVIPALGKESRPFRIAYIAPMADFATWRATNQKGDFDLKTFELHLRPESPLSGLRPGMTARVELPQ